jgi:hypothetical protein
MRFKLLGLLLLGAGLYLVIEGLFVARTLRDGSVLAQVYCLAAIFLAITVRVLQAERHHRASPRQSMLRSEPRLSPDPDFEPADFEEVPALKASHAKQQY